MSLALFFKYINSEVVHKCNLTPNSVSLSLSLSLFFSIPEFLSRADGGLVSAIKWQYPTIPAPAGIEGMLMLNQPFSVEEEGAEMWKYVIGKRLCANFQFSVQSLL